MTARLLLRMAWRNLWRHPRRTGLTAAAFAVGVFLLIFFLGLGDGMHEKMIDTGVRIGSGHVVVEPEGAREKVAANLVLTPDSVQAVQRVLASAPVARRIKGSAPRLLASGLLSSANNSTGVEVIGADAAREANFSLLPARLVEGRYLGPDGTTPPVVIGQALAEKLKVGLDAKVVLMTQAGSEIESQLLRVRGIFKTGMDDVDGHVITVPLADLQALLSRPGALSQEAIFLWRADDAQRVRNLIEAGLHQRPVSVLTWREAMPQLDQFIVVDDAGNYIFNGVVLIMVTLGVLNTVLMAVLERRREFGLLAALGMRPYLVSLMVMTEAMLLTALGAGVGLAAGLAAHRYFSVHGLNLALVGNQSFSAAGVAIDMVVKSYLYPGRIRWSLTIITALGALAALYPAWRAARTPPTEATRGL
jgi:ABC-type lipoprotein release transport system permease subunit